MKKIRRYADGNLKQNKPQLHLFRGNALSAEVAADLYERLTGRKATPQQIEAARKELTV